MYHNSSSEMVRLDRVRPNGIRANPHFAECPVNLLPKLQPLPRRSNLPTTIKVQIQLQGAEQTPTSKIATLHHQIVYRLQNHALDLPTPYITSDALMILADTDTIPTIIQIPKQIQKQELLKLMPLEWLTNYEHFHQNSDPVQTTEAKFEQRNNGQVKLSFQPPDTKPVSDAPQLSYTAMITAVQTGQETNLPIHGFSSKGYPVYPDKINGHFIWDVPEAHMCNPDCPCLDDTDVDEELEIMRRKKKKKHKPCYPKSSCKSFPPQPPPDPKPPVQQIWSCLMVSSQCQSYSESFPPLEKHIDPQTRVTSKPYVQSPVTASGQPKELKQYEAVLNWQTKNASAQYQTLHQLGRKIDRVASQVSQTETKVDTISNRLDQIYQKLQDRISELDTDLRLMINNHIWGPEFNKKEAEIRRLKVEIARIDAEKVRPSLFTQPPSSPSPPSMFDTFTPSMLLPDLNLNLFTIRSKVKVSDPKVHSSSSVPPKPPEDSPKSTPEPPKKDKGPMDQYYYHTIQQSSSDSSKPKPNYESHPSDSNQSSSSSSSGGTSTDSESEYADITSILMATKTEDPTTSSATPIVEEQYSNTEQQQSAAPAAPTVPEPESSIPPPVPNHSTKPSSASWFTFDDIPRHKWPAQLQPDLQRQLNAINLSIADISFVQNVNQVSSIPRPSLRMSILPSKFHKPIPVIGFIDTGADTTSTLPDKDLLIGFNILHLVKNLFLTNSGIHYKQMFLPYTNVLRLYKITDVPSPYSHISQKLLEFCLDSHYQFHHPSPLWKNEQFFIHLPFKLNQDINPTKASHLGISAVDRPKTAFCIPDAHYQWTVTPFGLKVAPSLFQKAMTKIFSPILHHALVYIDDILLFSPDHDSHQQLLLDFFNVVQEHGIMLSEKKSNIAKESIDFLGMVITNGHYQPGPHIATKLLKFPNTNLTKKHIQQFLGIINYVRDFIPRVAIHTSQLSRMVKKQYPPWGPAQTEAVKQLKVIAQSPPPLRIPTTGQRVPQTDANDDYWSAILLERIDGVDHFCAHASGQFKDSEKNYHVIYKEILAVKYGIKKFEFHLISHQFLINMDNSSFPRIFDFKNKLLPEKQLLNLKTWFSKYDFTVQHIKVTSVLRAYLMELNNVQPPTTNIHHTSIGPSHSLEIVPKTQTCTLISSSSPHGILVMEQRPDYTNVLFQDAQDPLEDFHSLLQTNDTPYTVNNPDSPAASTSQHMIDADEDKYQQAERI
ncbi:hypothetical protein KPL71_021631 [Citrus sinensis]|uniref:Uncharacterized protein n=1 Tax=Citrus sinensis TaxID=2711 RepID=A0ACB8JH78_CITSI|nr:hypothetical protein KPL71_021631 [Citrus sinensis]